MTRVCCKQHSTAYYSSAHEGRCTEDGFYLWRLGRLGRLSLIALRNGACWLHPRGIFRRSLKNNQWVTSSQTNILPKPLWHVFISSTINWQTCVRECAFVCESVCVCVKFNVWTSFVAPWPIELNARQKKITFMFIIALSCASFVVCFLLCLCNMFF